MPRSARPRKAVVLAAGFGTRLLPLSLDTPKPMIPLWGKPALGHVLDLLRGWGVREALVNLHFHPDAIVRYTAARSRPDFRITLSFEPDILGTAGALRRAAWFLAEREPFWLINADIAADVRPDPLLAALRRPSVLAALWLHPALGPRTVEMRRGLITTFQSARPETAGTFTFCGLHLVRPEVLAFIPPDGFSSIIEAYRQAMARGRRVAGVCDPGCYWEDLGTPESYRKAHGEVLARFRRGDRGGRLYDPDQARRARAFRRAGARLEGFVALGKDVVLEPGARVADSVLWDGARVAANGRVLQAVVGTGTTVRGEVRRLALRSEFVVQDGDTHADPLLGRVLRRLDWPPAQTVILPLEPRGSARSFTRLRRGNRSVILVRYSLDRHENALYADHARFLKRLGLRVPEVLADWPRERVLVLEDLGGRSLQDEAARLPPGPLFRLYARVLDDVRMFHTRGAPLARACGLELTPPFSDDLYRWEREFFARHFLRRHLGLPEPAVRAALRDLARVAARLAGLPRVLIHRDLQSSNVLLVRGRPAFIDFQGMRLGPAAYDLASLLCDPYVTLPPGVRERLLAHYAERAGWGAERREAFWWAAIERLAQALGAYGRLVANPETAGFARHIPPALERMREALGRIPPLPALRAAVEKALAGVPNHT